MVKEGLRFEYSDIIQLAECCTVNEKIKKKSDKVTIVQFQGQSITTNETWLEEEIIKSEDEFVILFKRVSSEYKTQEGKANETNWKIGTVLTHPNWNPYKEECGDGKFHACSRPYFCDEFRSTLGDKYIAIKIHKKDLYVWPKNSDYLHKIAFREGLVLYEVNKFGKRI